MAVPLWVWAVTIAGFALVLGVDVLVVGRRPGIPTVRQSSLWVAFYVALAIAFGIGLGLVWDAEHAGQFFAGWITEYSLSLDNLFVFLLLMRSYRVPAQTQRIVLLTGIVIALVLRGIFIVLGAEILHRFEWVFYLFGAFLLWTAVKLIGDRATEHDATAPPDTILVRVARRVLPLQDEYVGQRYTVRREGRLVFTPLLLVILAIGTTDLLFALDSIPAIFGLTRVPYLVFVANGFALLGLVQLFFLLGGLLERLVYLSLGLAVILGFIGIKLVFQAMHTNQVPFINGGEPVEWAPEIPIAVSLAVIVGVLLVTIAASLGRDRYLSRG
jgi:tellurite resistance protein TerC